MLTNKCGMIESNVKIQLIFLVEWLDYLSIVFFYSNTTINKSLISIKLGIKGNVEKIKRETDKPWRKFSTTSL